MQALRGARKPGERGPALPHVLLGRDRVGDVKNVPLSAGPLLGYHGSPFISTIPCAALLGHPFEQRLVSWGTGRWISREVVLNVEF